MKNCEEYKKLIEKYLDGMITDNELTELQKHTETCPSCHAEFEHVTLMEDAVKQAFLSDTSAEQVGASLVAKLPAELDRRPLTVQPVVLFDGMRAAVAAIILLAAGLLVGFALGRIGEPSETPMRAEVPISVGEIKGTVLVRHEGSDVWRTLEVDSKVHLGDTFHSVSKSACVLKLDNHSTLELDQNSMLVLRSYNGRTQFYLEHGKLDAALESPHPPFFISTPHGQVEALGTEFTVKVIDE